MSKSEKTASHHWILQRASAVFFLPLAIWLIYQFNYIFFNIEDIGSFVINPINVTLFMMFVITGFYHAVLGLQVIFEDYIQCGYARFFLMVLTYFISIFTAIITLFAVITVHLL